MEKTSLISSLQFHFQSRIVLPANPHASRLPHNTDGTITLALLAGRFVLRRIPGIGDTAALRVDGDAVEVTFARSHHAGGPVFGDHRNPSPCEIDGRARSSRGWRLRGALTSLSAHANRRRNQE